MTTLYVAYQYLAGGALFLACTLTQHFVHNRRFRELGERHKDQVSMIHESYTRQGSMQAEELKLLRAQNEQINEIALFLRSNYKHEIELGYHNRPFAQIINGYLGKERECQKQHRH